MTVTATTSAGPAGNIVDIAYCVEELRGPDTWVTVETAHAPLRRIDQTGLDAITATIAGNRRGPHWVRVSAAATVAGVALVADVTVPPSYRASTSTCRPATSRPTGRA